MTILYFYEKIVPLNSELHRKLRISPASDGYAFAGRTNVIPLMGVEFMEAAKEYPVVFSRVGENFLPVALVGLRNSENLLVNAEGEWDARYVPAFARRYPFVFDQSEPNGTLTVCIDESYSGFDDEEGVPLFDENGGQSARLTEVVSFLNDFHAQALQTGRFAKRLAELDLLVESTANVNLANNQSLTLAGIYAIDEARLLKLDDAVVLEMFRAGELALVYSHLASLSNVQRLTERLAERVQAE
jgi:hypothetical protein